MEFELRQMHGTTATSSLVTMEHPEPSQFERPLVSSSPLIPARHTVRDRAADDYVITIQKCFSHWQRDAWSRVLSRPRVPIVFTS